MDDILWSWPMRPPCDPCLLCPSVPDTPSVQNKEAPHSLGTFINDLEIPAMSPEMPTQLLSLLSNPMASPFQSVLACPCSTTPLSKQNGNQCKAQLESLRKHWTCAFTFIIITEISPCMHRINFTLHSYGL